MAEKELHKFCAGRTYGYIANNDFSEGYSMFETGNKIKTFITRTLGDAGAIHSEDRTAAGDGDPVVHADAPPMPGVIVDGQLVNEDGLNDGWGGDSDDSDNDIEMAHEDSGPRSDIESSDDSDSDM